MVLVGRRLSADELQAVLEDPAKVDDLLYGDLDDDQAEMPEPELDLDKSWHGIHYLLTGTAWETGADPAGAAILGGEEIGADGGYGPARLLRPEAVRTIAAALDGLSIESLRARFDPQAMTAADIYPTIWMDGADEFDSYLAPHFTELRRFYQTAAAGRQAVLLAIT
ncbi:YfbM family protein [Dactylosporangium sp. NPDC048998]|uniref:YfbM family protein n=1 Tax=Dactylosporangium sp. NPDC048998 TaxID=3363976 RepID=UPI003715B9E6